jgi:membrane protease YdiL (CAAX protease family)
VCARKAVVLRDAGAGQRASTGGAQTHPKPAPRRISDTPRSLSAARMRDDRATRTVPEPKGGKRGGFQWTLLEAIAMLSVTFSAFTAKESAALLPAFRTVSPSMQVPLRVAMLALYYVVQVAVLAWLVRRRRGEPTAALGMRSQHQGFWHALTSAGLVAAGLVVTRLAASLYAYITRAVGLMPSATTDLTTLFGANTTGFVLAIVMVVVVGPVVEEAVFRGALLEGLVARFGRWPGILLQALLFAAFHRSLWMLVPTFVLGVVLGWLAHERDSLWPPIALHALYNAITVAAAFLVAGSI